MKNDYFETKLRPYIEKSADTAPSLLPFLRRKWKQFEKVPGIQTLLAAGDHESICKIFDLAT